MKSIPAILLAGLFASAAAYAAEPARILINQVGYEASGPKQAVVQGSAADSIGMCSVRTFPDEKPVYEVRPEPAVAVDHWQNWRFWRVDFSTVQSEGEYVVQCAHTGGNGKPVLESRPFWIERDVLERHTLSAVLAYFESDRVAGAMDRADSNIGFYGDDSKPRIDAHGGWYDATGDYGVHLSQANASIYFLGQNIAVVAYSLARSWELLSAHDDRNLSQLDRRILAGATYGADFLVRMHPKEGGSFYESIMAPGAQKKPEDRQIQPHPQGSDWMTSNGYPKIFADHPYIYQVSFRAGGGFAIAALAIDARLPWSGDFSKATYLQTAEEAFAYLQKHNTSLLLDGKENIQDDFSALLAASELLRTTHDAKYRKAAQQRADALLARLSGDKHYQGFWRRGGPGSGPYFTATTAGAPVLALLNYYPQADAATRARIKNAVKRALTFHLKITNDVANPFGYAREYIENDHLGRAARFFFPHDVAGYWWQGENARIASLATAARLALPLFVDDPAFSKRLRVFATDQINWVLGLNPFDSSMMNGVGYNNPEYFESGSWEYTQRPGGISNGITSAWDTKDDEGISYSVPNTVTHQGWNWRWNEQWLPHDAWYLLAMAARGAPGMPTAAVPRSGE